MLNGLLGHCNGFNDALRFEMATTISYVCVPMQEGWIVKPRNKTQGGGNNLGLADHLAQLQPIMTVETLVVIAVISFSADSFLS